MATASLTKRTVDAARPKEVRYTIFDTKLSGFGLRIFPSGAKSWIVEYRPGEGGRTVAKRRLTIGSAATLTPDQARAQAERILAQARLGADPSADRSEARAAVDVRELAASFLAEHVLAKRKPRTVEHYEDVLRRIVLPEIGSRKAASVTTADVAKLHLAWKGRAAQANFVLAVVSSMFSFGASRGLVPKGSNPASGIEKFREEARERFLGAAELKALGQALHEAETIGVPWAVNETKPVSRHMPKAANRRTVVDKHAVAALRLLLLTGCRLREILHLRWSDVDLDRGMLFLPTSKTGRRSVILNGAAIAVLDSLARGSELVIPGQADAAGHVQPRRDLKRPWAAIARRAGLVDVRLHDLRHTYASHGAASGMGLPILGELLGYAEPKTTARYAHLADTQLRRASEAIGRALLEQMNGNPGNSES